MNRELQCKINVLILLFFPLIILAQARITGTVVDGSTSSPLGEVSVLIKGTTTGTISDFDGKFILNVDRFPVTLVFSSLGFVSFEEVVNEKRIVNVRLQEAATALDEVVITGLATSIKRSNAANAVASVSAEELIGRTPAQTLDGALSGKFTGALVSANSGAPGGGLSIKLRGVTSVLGNSQPLYIIDGVYIDNSSIQAGLNTVSGANTGGSDRDQDNPSNRIADINPDDIANIEILKGASAAAIYGSRAAAGVVIITTKKGKAGRTKIRLAHSLGFNQAINLQGMRNFTEASVLASFGAASVPLFVAARDSGQLHDYEDEIFGENGFISNTTISASGGSEKTTFYTGFTHNEEDGIVKGTGYTKNSVRLNIDHKISDHIKFSIVNNYINSTSNRGFFNNDNTGTTIGVALVGTPPWAQLFPDGNGVYPDNAFGASNPLQARDLITNKETVNRFIIGSSLDINIYSTDNSNLKAILRAGLDYYSLGTVAIFPKNLQFQAVNGGDNGVSIQGTTENKNANYSAFLVHNYTTDNEVNFRSQVGVTNETFSRNSILSTAKDLLASETNLDQANSLQVNQTRVAQEDAGFFVQEEVNYQDRIIATLGLRGDKSSNNNDANKFFYYPKASVAFNLHSFDFWKSETINQLKVRVAYGESGNFAPNGALFTSFGSTVISGGSVSLLGATLSGVIGGNPNIQPERQKELETGFDIGILNNKVTLSFTYYKKQVEDLILQAALQPSTGIQDEFINAGELENKGIEISLNIKAFEKEDFSWNSGINFWTNTSKITKLNIPPFELGAFGATLGTFKLEEGKSATQIVGISENGTIEHGDAEADFQVTFNNDFRYKDFTLSFLWHWKQGGDNVNLSTLLFDLNGTTHDFDDVDLDPAGVLGNGPYRLSRLGVSADAFVEDASYLRLREIGLYYTIPKKSTEKWFGSVVSDVKCGFSGNNLINIFDYNSYDPEVSNFGVNGISTGVEVLPFPSSKRYMFHVSANF